MKADFPVVSDKLLEALQKAFPDKSPRNEDITPVQVGVLIGVQKVMDFIRMQHAKQNILEG